jgi:UDPglucose 6-dehydrogenase
MARIAVIGTGYVGLGTGVIFAEIGHQVIGVEIDQEKLEQLRSGVSPIYEPSLDEMLQKNIAAGRIHFSSDYADAVPEADFVFICVNTPSASNGGADMSYVRKAASTVGQYLAPGRHTIVINKSTVPIGSGELVQRLLESSAPPTATFDVVSNPEFLREGSAVADMLEPDRVVLGSRNRQAAKAVAQLYEPFDAPVLVTDLRTAEMIKYASNAFLATKISFINEVARISEALDVDVRDVAKGMGLDKRIGPHFLNAGVGFGGSCFPKDVKALEFMAADAECHPQLLRTVLDINREARHGFVRKLVHLLGNLEGTTIAIWGLSFKPNTDDMREAPSLDIIRNLMERGASVRVYDPAAMPVAKAIMHGITYCEDPYDAAQGADAVALVTEWDEFNHLDLERVRDSMVRPVLVDGRNLYDPLEMARLGFQYRGIGVPAAV